MSDIVTGKIFVDGERGITATKLNQIQSLAVVQPDFYLNKATSSTLDPTDILLELKGTGSYAQITGANLISSVSASVSGVRPRSYNAIGNPTFEVDQRNVGNSVGWTALSSLDRWFPVRAGTLGGQAQQITGPVLLPGTNFAVSSKFLRITLGTQETTMGAGDFFQLTQSVEGPQWRELMSDVHSVSLLVRSSVAGLSFGLYLRDPATVTKSLTSLCTIPNVNTWTLITIPNIPVWASGNFVVTPGLQGYQIGITLACGSTYMSPANGIWQSGNFIGALGQSNFAASAVNSTFDIAFVQHEPGSLCTTPIDKPFTQNLDECLRYFQKTYDYDVAVGTANAVGAVSFVQSSPSLVVGPTRFHKPTAKIPTMTSYNSVTGAANSLQLSGSAYAVTAFNSPGKAGFLGINATSMPTVGAGVFAQLHYTADTGW